MRWFNLVLVVNVILAIGLGIFAYEMLPYAKAVACEINKTDSLCSEFSQLQLVGASLVPVLIVAVFIFIALLLIKCSKPWGIGIASIPPLLVFGWYLFIATAH
ncbi:MAG: putative membrane protein [Bermanella sp.]|jgi:uncharacterized membrane protein